MKYALRASVASILLVSSASAQSLSADSWDDAVSKISCDHMKDNKNGTWSIAGTVVISGYTFANPTLGNKDTIDSIKKKCACKHPAGGATKGAC
jgi:hypothetical protein